ncbi:MAG: protein kinase domain-containing protein, partial [Candidatus Methylomirabilales bacterium]
MEPEMKLAGRYRLEVKIASGHLATLWRATDEVLGRRVAAKVLHPGLAADAVFAGRFRRQALAAAGLVHPNIVSIFDTGEHDGVPFVVMELLGGGSLQDLLRSGGFLEPQEAARIGACVCEALAHAHRAGLAHGYVTPANILFSETRQVKLGDAGVAWGAFEQDRGREAAQGAGPDGRADTYALAAVLYESLVGRPPFDARLGPTSASAPVPLRKLRPEVPAHLDLVLMRALAPSPENRLADAAEMAGLLGSGPEPATEPSIQPPLGRSW